MLEVVKSVYKSVGLEVDGELLTLEVGNNIEVTTEDGVVIEGTLMNIGKKAEKTELTIQPKGAAHLEQWKVINLKDVKLVTV